MEIIVSGINLPHAILRKKETKVKVDANPVYWKEGVF